MRGAVEIWRASSITVATRTAGLRNGDGVCTHVVCSHCWYMYGVFSLCNSDMHCFWGYCRSVGGEARIGIFAAERLEKSVELSIDYKWEDVGRERMP